MFPFLPLFPTSFFLSLLFEIFPFHFEWHVVNLSQPSWGVWFIVFPLNTPRWPQSSQSIKRPGKVPCHFTALLNLHFDVAPRFQLRFKQPTPRPHLAHKRVCCAPLALQNCKCVRRSKTFIQVCNCYFLLRCKSLLISFGRIFGVLFYVCRPFSVSAAQSCTVIWTDAGW